MFEFDARLARPLGWSLTFGFDLDRQSRLRHRDLVLRRKYHTGGSYYETTHK